MSFEQETYPKPVCGPDTNQEVKTELLTLEQMAAALNLTPERLKQMQDYAKNLKKKFPKMKADRIRRKTAEYFKIKLT